MALFSSVLNVCVCADSQYGVVPKHTDGLGALLGGDQAELHGDGFVQRVLQQLVVVMDGDADHRRVDDRTLRDAEEDRTTPNFSFNVCLLSTDSGTTNIQILKTNVTKVVFFLLCCV